MNLIQNITTDLWQRQQVPLPDNSLVSLDLQFLPQQQGWVFNTISYGNFTLQGLWIANHANLLHQWRNQIPFGLACYSTDAREPMLLTDFNSGASKLYLLTAADCAAYTAFLND